MLVDDNSFSLVSEDDAVGGYIATKEEERLSREHGALILEGDGSDGDGECDGGEPSVLSIPDSVLLPSELTIRAGAQSQEDEVAGINRRSLKSRVPGWLLLPVLLLVAISSCALRSRTSWKNEALRLNAEIIRQRKLALLSTASLLNERKGLNERLEQCTAEKAERSSFKNDDDKASAFMPDRTEDDDAVLKLKNCYFEASVSLGHCSRQWQKWWEDEKPASQDGGENNFDDDDSFTFAMSKLMDKVAQGVKEGTNNFIDSSAQSLDRFRETLDLEHLWRTENLAD